MDLVKAEALLVEAVNARIATGEALDLIGDQKAAAAREEREADLDLNRAVSEATQALTGKRPLSRDSIEAFNSVQARRGLVELIRRGLVVAHAAATLAHMEAQASEAELEAILTSERLKAHLQAQGEASRQLAELEGGEASIQIEGPASARLKADLAAARDKAQFLRHKAESEALKFEMTRLEATAKVRRLA